jgi:hypothetical protein
MRKRRSLLTVCVALFFVAAPLAACGGSDDAAPASTSIPADTTATTAPPSPTTTTQPTTSQPTTTDATTTTAPAEPTTTVSESTVPPTDVPGPPAGTALNVVLLDEADQLNVRTAADPAADIVTRLDPATEVTATGRAAEHDGSIWYEITTDATTGWANSFYLTEQWEPGTFATDSRVTGLVDKLFDVFIARGDLNPVTGRRGLIVSHFDPPRRFKPAELATLLTSTTEYGWGSSGCSPEECGTSTFTETFADPYIQAYDDADRETVFDEIIGGGNMMINPIPAKFIGLHYVAFYDPGDNPEYGGLDWSTWYVYFTRHFGEPVIVGLSTDEWAP